MTFWEHFLRLLPHKPLRALGALYWHVTRRRVRARNRLYVASADLPFAYEVWINRKERSYLEENDFRTTDNQWNYHPSFFILIHGNLADSDRLAKSVRSVEAQLYKSWNLGDLSKSVSDRLKAADDDYVLPLRVGDVLSESALVRYADELQGKQRPSILYGDQDELTDQGRRRPWFKPRWNEELFFALDYLSSAVAIKTGVAHMAMDGDFIDIEGLVVSAATQSDDEVRHVPHVLVHVDPTSERGEQVTRRKVIENQLEKRGGACRPGPFGTIRVQWPLPADLPLVTLIIPTRDKIELLQQCIESIQSKTDYANYEIIIVDNGSIEPRTKAFLGDIVSTDPRVRILAYDGPFNYSAINNFAARLSKGTFICLLNNDTEVIEPAWLSELMRYAVRPEIGAVGAKLLYEDGSIQHAGVVVGLGEAAGHAHRFLPAGDPGYFRMAHVAQFTSAVTGACLLVEKKKFMAVRGLDEKNLPIAYNDVDLCLKLEAAGWRNVYVPHAVLIHHESKSREKDMAPERVDDYMRELAFLQDRWETKTYVDPLHNPNLDRYSETFVFRI